MATGEKQVNVGFKIDETEYILWKRISLQEKRSLKDEVRDAMAERISKRLNPSTSPAVALEEL